MAKILGLKEQQKALREINSTLKEFEPINEFLKIQNPSDEYTISFKDENGKTIQTKLLCDDKEPINILVKAYKENLVQSIKQKAAQYNIGLEEEELALISGESHSSSSDSTFTESTPAEPQ